MGQSKRVRPLTIIRGGEVYMYTPSLVAERGLIFNFLFSLQIAPLLVNTVRYLLYFLHHISNLFLVRLLSVESGNMTIVLDT